MKQEVERRKHMRFEVHGGTFAVLKPYFYKRGQIIDMGEGGLAFRYVASDEMPNENLQSETWLDIFSPEYQTSGANMVFGLQGVPIKPVSDFELARISFGSISQRRCSVQFKELTQNQRFELEYFIQKYNLGMVHTQEVHP
ncbi:MAG: hypothetical protein SWE60_12070 [Thermodesulfobacteriota bacterium]|nr:hypothetical protein [Thermodesulfobacteriota bacterium]